jgi:peptidoglycan hydrolase CwlO-like protein
MILPKIEVGRQFKTVFCISFLLFIALSSFPESGFAQTSASQKKEQLQKQMKKLQDEIKLISAAIRKTNASKEKNLGELLSLQAKIKSRQKLIDNINFQIHDLDEIIARTEEDIVRPSVTLSDV